jgi:hypothetical protein
MVGGVAGKPTEGGGGLAWRHKSHGGEGPGPDRQAALGDRCPGAAATGGDGSVRRGAALGRGGEGGSLTHGPTAQCRAAWVK